MSGDRRRAAARTGSGPSARQRIAAAMALGEDAADAADLLEAWLEAAPEGPEVEAHERPRFGCVLARGGARRTWLAEAGAEVYVGPLTAFFREAGIDEEPIGDLLRFGRAAGLERLGAWLTEGDGEQDGGWWAPGSTRRSRAFGVAPASAAAEAARMWAEHEGIAEASELRRSVVGEAGLTEMRLPMADLDTARRAFEALSVPFPGEAVGAAFERVPPGSLALGLALGAGGLVELGLVALTPAEALVEALWAMAPDEAGGRRAAYEATLGPSRVEAAEWVVASTASEPRLQVSVSPR